MRGGRLSGPRERRGEQVRLVHRHGLEHLGRVHAVAGDALADLDQEHVEALARGEARRFLVAVGKGRGDGQHVADEQGESSR